MRLTDITNAPSVSETDLIHVVLTGDTSQDQAGSSYKVEIGQYKSIFSNDNQNNFVRNLIVNVNDLPLNFTEQDVCNYINNFGLTIDETDSKWNIIIINSPS